MSLSPSLLPLKKRALNDSGGGSSPDDSCSPSPKKRKEDAGGREAPVIPRQHRRRAPDAVAAKAKPLSAAEKWLKKGKWIVTAQEAASPVAPPEPPVKKKFMQDGIRSFAETAARIERNRGGVAPRPRDGDAPMVYADGDLGEALERRLADLGATRPWFVYQKTLWKSDVCSNQNRLLVSCKRDTGVEGCPITACFSADEWRRVENKDVGLLVTALDRDAVPYKLTCKFLDSNGGYRFISGWKDFLRRNGVGLDSRGRWTRDVDVELRAFRSRALQRQPLLDGNGKVLMVKGEDGKLNKTLEVDDHFHPDGSLGLILLHHEHRRRRAEPEEEEDDGDYDQGMGSPVARDKHKKPREKRVAPVAAPAPASPMACAGPGAEQSMSKVEMVDKFGEPMSNMVIGMMMLRGTISKESLDNVEGDGVVRSDLLDVGSLNHI